MKHMAHTHKTRNPSPLLASGFWVRAMLRTFRQRLTMLWLFHFKIV